jgi:hypothetical protein
VAATPNAQPGPVPCPQRSPRDPISLFFFLVFYYEKKTRILNAACSSAPKCSRERCCCPLFLSAFFIEAAAGCFFAPGFSLDSETLLFSACVK